jgi:hypothetical protein
MTLGIKNMPLIAFTYLIFNLWLFIITSKATMKTCAAGLTVLSFSVMYQNIYCHRFSKYSTFIKVIILQNKKPVSHTQPLFSVLLTVINNEVLEVGTQNFVLR